jgi:predicted transcriptional regulator of viral defense system
MQRVSQFLAHRLQKKNWPVITEYELFLEFASLYQLPAAKRRELYLRSNKATRSKFSRVVKDLRKARHIRPDSDFYLVQSNRAVLEDQEFELPRGYALSTSQHHKVFRVADVPDGTAEDVSALVDPFCVVSHLSAMQYYGLSERRPRELMLMTPDVQRWREQRVAKYSKDTSNFELDNQDSVRLERITLPRRLRGRPLAVHSTRRTYAALQAREKLHRIPPVEEVFVEMLDRPELCGGMAHVIEVWHTHAGDRLEKIVRAIAAVPDSILKVRAGFLLEESMQLRHPIVDSWAKLAQRGGSRRLDPSRPYAPRFSEKWMISINVESDRVPEKSGH